MSKQFNISELVIDRLQAGKLRREHVDALAKGVAEVEDSGIRILKILDNGIPWPDEIVVFGSLSREQGPSVMERLLALENLAHLRVFPKGIPWPDLLDIELSLSAKMAPTKRFDA